MLLLQVGLPQIDHLIKQKDIKEITISRNKTVKFSCYVGLTAVIIGLIAFSLSWNLWDFWGGRPMPGVQLILLPGNLTLKYFWHPLFTEEVNFWPKLLMLMLGQFFVSAVSAAIAAVLLQVIKGKQRA
ncbi:hypothetical protein [Pseudoalteromonas 'SMAR']|uniref:hypothetical protein n=1 Tax=Pseudoalteromonas 'SMAR' TaxID=3416908 RepID=UPI003AF234F4